MSGQVDLDAAQASAPNLAIASKEAEKLERDGGVRYGCLQMVFQAYSGGVLTPDEIIDITDKLASYVLRGKGC